MRRAVFLDRDGVLNRLVAFQGRMVSPRRFADFSILPGAEEAIRQLRAAGLLAIVVTNQPEVRRGHLDPHELISMHRHLSAKTRVDAVYVCPHDDSDRCSCRKPKPGLLLQASREWKIALGDSFLVGDTWKDIAAGRAVGCTTVLVRARSEGSEKKANLVARDLPEAARVILGGARSAFSFPPVRRRAPAHLARTE